jgi:hypothetical protein
LGYETELARFLLAITVAGIFQIYKISVLTGFRRGSEILTRTH